MSKTWDTSYENSIDDDTAGSLIDDTIRTLMSEIRKRLETFFDNWANDPDAPTTLDVKDDAILAEHISGLTGTGAVDLDNIPDGSDYVRLSKSAQTIYGAKTFNDEIYDKNGNEVVAMQIETKQYTTTKSVSSNSTTTITVSGFSFDPTAVLGVYYKWDTNSDINDAGVMSSLYGSDGTSNTVSIDSISFGAGSVSITFRNANDSYTCYVHRVIVTAART